MNDRELLATARADAIAELNAGLRELEVAVERIRRATSPAPEAGSDSASPSLTAVKRYENIDRAAKRVLSVFDVARSPHGAPSRVVEPDGATDALCALMDAVEGFAPPSRAETPTEADCAEAWYTAGTITCPEGLVRRTTTAGREITLSAQTWVRIAAVRALCLTAPPAGMDAAPVVLYDLEAVVDRLARFLAPGTLSSAIVPALHDALQKHRLTPIAPPPVARETTSGIDRRVLGSALQHIDEARADVAALLDAARQLSPSGEEKSVDVPALIEFMHENYGWNPDGDADLWARELTAALKEQGIPTRAPKVDGGGV